MNGSDSDEGEITLVIAGADAEAMWDEARAELARLMEGRMDRKSAAKVVADKSGWKRREVYRFSGGVE